MALPYVFANVSQLNTPELDADFNALGALVTIPCTATGTNTIVLTPTANTPTLAAYSSLAPQFAFIAAATSSGAVTVNINGLGAKKLYKNQGAVQCGASDITSGGLYTIVYNSALDSAVGGFVLTNQTLVVTAPTVQRLLSGSSATYTATAGTVRQRVRGKAGGGGGGAQVTNSGGTGGTSSFQVNATGTAWTCIGGGAGTPGPSGGGGTGGTNGSTGTLINRTAGAPGGVGFTNGSAGGGSAGSGGGKGAGKGVTNAAAATAGVANSGGGGAGGSASATLTGGGGGGEGEEIEFWVTGMTTATYTVGAGGTAGAAGTIAGAAGGTGVWVIEEFYI